LFAVDASECRNVYIWPGEWGDVFFDGSPIREVKANLAPMGLHLVQVKTLEGLIDPALIISFDVPIGQLHFLNNYNKHKLILMLWEPPSVKFFNYDSSNHVYFSKIYTWNDDIIDNKRYVKFYNFSLNQPLKDIEIKFENKKLCAMVCKNKRSTYSKELYSERVRAIEFFELLHGQEFDLYGHGWERYKSYRGIVNDKIQCLNHYKFCICYENVKDIPGYVTEKLFDCFYAGCVPIYWGASNVEKYVPKNCFIARTDFASYEALYNFIKNMSKEKYQEYLFHINAFLKTEMAHRFTENYFVEFFQKLILSNVDKEG
jgi:hypothetical protein